MKRQSRITPALGPAVESLSRALVAPGPHVQIFRVLRPPSAGSPAPPGSRGDERKSSCPSSRRSGAGEPIRCKRDTWRASRVRGWRSRTVFGRSPAHSADAAPAADRKGHARVRGIGMEDLPIVLEERADPGALDGASISGAKQTLKSRMKSLPTQETHLNVQPKRLA